MTKNRAEIVTDWLEEQGFSPAEIENVKGALQSPPAWLPLAVVSGISITVGEDMRWTATILGVGDELPPAIRHAYENGGQLQLGLRRVR